MATRGTIAVVHPNGTVSQIYTHWDSYITNNGELLYRNYNSYELANELLLAGDISILGSHCIPKTPTHTFDSPEADCTVYYSRDRGDDECEPRQFASIEEYLRNGQFQEYNYLFVDGQWEVTYHDRTANLREELNQLIDCKE